ncbi:hypothetical protein BURPS1710A_3577 [Burkholderia pseudomallei 1710a]|uniref:Uncharacterized protein n=1 Tax=Burkholderia pseudomallei 1710a TaxID=320371 RepID=A0A0E1W5N3_BURPE|nr:hypothetical protein BURPS1710A_3577 [Burkholderia pseudomallei 1710a]
MNAFFIVCVLSGFLEIERTEVLFGDLHHDYGGGNGERRNGRRCETACAHAGRRAAHRPVGRLPGARKSAYS